MLQYAGAVPSSATKNINGTHSNTLQQTETHAKHTATHCNTMQHTAALCSTLPHTTTHYHTLQHAGAVASPATKNITDAHCNTQ